MAFYATENKTKNKKKSLPGATRPHVIQPYLSSQLISSLLAMLQLHWTFFCSMNLPSFLSSRTLFWYTLCLWCFSSSVLCDSNSKLIFNITSLERFSPSKVALPTLTKYSVACYPIYFLNSTYLIQIIFFICLLVCCLSPSCKLRQVLCLSFHFYFPSILNSSWLIESIQVFVIKKGWSNWIINIYLGNSDKCFNKCWQWINCAFCWKSIILKFIWKRIPQIRKVCCYELIIYSSGDLLCPVSQFLVQ